MQTRTAEAAYPETLPQAVYGTDHDVKRKLRYVFLPQEAPAMEGVDWAGMCSDPGEPGWRDDSTIFRIINIMSN